MVANAIILQNTIDLSQAIQAVRDQGFPVTTELLAGLSPYLTSKIKRYGDYILDMLTQPLPFEEIIAWVHLTFAEAARVFEDSSIHSCSAIIWG